MNKFNNNNMNTQNKSDMNNFKNNTNNQNINNNNNFNDDDEWYHSEEMSKFKKYIEEVSIDKGSTKFDDNPKIIKN